MIMVADDRRALVAALRPVAADRVAAAVEYMPYNEKVRAKVGELAAQVDVVLGNLDDAIPIEAKADACEAFIAMARVGDRPRTCDGGESLLPRK